MPGQRGAQQGVHIDQLHVYTDSGLGCEVLIDQVFDYIGLVTAGTNPQRDDLTAALFICNITHLVVVDNKRIVQAA